MKLNINEDMYKLIYTDGKKFAAYITIDEDERLLVKKLKSYKFKADGKPKAFKVKNVYGLTSSDGKPKTDTNVGMLLGVQDNKLIFDRDVI